MYTHRKELFYQLAIFDFANFGVLKLSVRTVSSYLANTYSGDLYFLQPAAPVFNLVMLALELPESGNITNIPTR